MNLNSYVRFDNATLLAVPSGIQVTDSMGFIYMISAIDMNGRGISVLNGSPGQTILITRSKVGPQYSYYMKLDAAAAARTDTQFSANRQAIGDDIQCSYVQIIPPPGMIVHWRKDQSTTIHKDAPRETQVHDLVTENDVFGFHLSIIPSVCGRATTLDINEYNTSLIGFESNGAPRTERSEINTKLMVSNDGSTFVIGGVDKKSVINSVSKVPWVGSLPGLGWLLGSESSVTKNVRIVTVLECKPIHLNTTMPDNIQKDIQKVLKKTKSATKKSNKIGFDQFLIDKNKMSLDKLP
jgi:general secretion pathway protein D